LIRAIPYLRSHQVARTRDRHRASGIGVGEFMPLGIFHEAETIADMKVEDRHARGNDLRPKGFRVGQRGVAERPQQVTRDLGPIA
jgi:hypothetical protein